MSEKEDTALKQHESKTMALLIVSMFAVAIVFLILIILFICYAKQTENSAEPVIFIYNLDGTNWNDNKNVDIFYNEEFGSAKIAPNSSGTFEFLFKNESDCKLSYTVEFSEENEYDIALRYKLSRDEQYLVDEYSDVASMGSQTLTIEQNSYHYFQLEWWWDANVNDENDTLAGMNNAIYSLTITITATLYE